MQMFTGADTPRWGLHMFAISTDRNQQLEQAMAYKYNARASASEYIDANEYIFRFKNLKVNLLTLIRVYILTYLKAKS